MLLQITMIVLLNHCTEYFFLFEIQKLDFIFNFLKMNMLPSREIKSTFPFKFYVNSTNVYKKCWCSIYHISHEKFNHTYESVIVNYVKSYNNSASMNIQVFYYFIILFNNFIENKTSLHLVLCKNYVLD